VEVSTRYFEKLRDLYGLPVLPRASNLELGQMVVMKDVKYIVTL